MKGLSLPFAVLISACVLMASATAAGSAETPASEAIAVTLRDKALHADSIAWDFVSELTTRFGPRPAGSASEKAAAQWAERKLKALGFENVHIESFPITAWVRGAERAEIIGPNPQPLTAASLGGAPPTPAGGVEGEIVPFANLEALTAAAPGSLNGKIAMITFHMPRTQNGSGYGYSVAGRGMGPIEAAKRGAIGFVIRSVATSGRRFAHAGATRFAEGKVPIPAFSISEPDGDQIERLMALGEKVRVRLTSAAAYVPNSMSYNISGDIRGSTRPNEVIVLGAHMDSWDLGTGAVDDAAGDAIIVAAARLVRDAPRKPQRTIRVVLYGSEEVTQPTDVRKGDRTYTETHKAELATHISASESDFGADRVYSVSLPQGVAGSPFAQTLLRVLAPLGVIPSSVKPQGGSDVEPLGEAGVPLIDLNQDGSKYFDLHHTADDTLDKIEPAALSQNVAAWTTMAWLVADSDVDFRALATH